MYSDRLSTKNWSKAIASSIKSPTSDRLFTKNKIKRSPIQLNYLTIPIANSVQNYQVCDTTDQLFFQE